jgi:uncharacterized membrane protein YbaN (DUF454 family)
MPPQPAPPLRPLTRKEFYDLTVYCRTYASELARYDQHRVRLKECNRFNTWLAEIKRYDRLSAPLRELKPARPIARWQIVVLLIVLWLILWIALPGRVDRGLLTAILMGGIGTIVVMFFLPESLYGTTMELLDGKVLRVVDVLLELLNKGDMGFSEAVYFRAKENLTVAREELRLQIDLAHR